MSLKVSKGQKITAIHTNKIVDAICSLENTTNKLQKQKNQSKDLIQVPVFDFCWYQPDNTNVVLYVNTQNEPNKMVMYNGCYSTYCDLGYELPTTDSTYPPPLTISGDYLVNASYSAIKNFTLGCDAVQNICLTIFKDGISSSYYTFADEDKLPSGDCETIVQTFLIGTYSKGNFQQLHDGILTYSDLSGANESIKVDTEVSNSGVATIERIYSSSISSDYISLYHADEGYDNPLLRSAISAEDTTDDCGSVLSPLDSELRTVFLRKSWNTIETGETDDEGNPLSISVPNTTIEYGKPEEYFIINDVCGVETAPFVLPKQLSSYCDLVIGNNDCETYYSTLYFENPWKTDLICPGENPLVRTDYVLVLDMCETDPEDGPCRAVWKRYLPGMEAGDYIRVAEGEPGSSHIATVSGPYMCLRINNDTNNGVQEFKYDPINHIWWLYLNQMNIKSGDYIRVSMDPVDEYYAINGPKMVLDTKCATCDSIANNGVDGSFTYNNSLNQWTLKLALDNETLTSNICIEVDSNVEINSGDYINVTGGNNSYTVNGPEMCVCIVNQSDCETLKPITGSFEYLNNTWTLNLTTDICTITGGGLTTKLCEGDYIHIDESTTADGNPLYTVHGPIMCVCVTYPNNCETLSPITASFSFDTNNEKWDLNICTKSIIGPSLCAGCYITINDGTINGPSIEFICSAMGCVYYNETNHKWVLCVNNSGSSLPYAINPNCGGNVTASSGLVDGYNTWEFISNVKTPTAECNDGNVFTITGANSQINFNLNLTELANQLDICSGGGGGTGGWTPTTSQACTLERLDSCGYVAALNGLQGCVNIASDTLTVTTDGSTIKIENSCGGSGGGTADTTTVMTAVSDGLCSQIANECTYANYDGTNNTLPASLYDIKLIWAYISKYFGGLCDSIMPSYECVKTMQIPHYYYNNQCFMSCIGI